MVRVASLWKIINLVYTRALNPDIEQWRVGALVKLVKAFEHCLDPWAARSVRGHEDMRRHMNLMVKRLLDRAALIAENAARDLFPNDQGVLHPQPCKTQSMKDCRYTFLKQRASFGN